MGWVIAKTDVIKMAINDRAIHQSGSAPHPLVGAPAPGQHEDVLHLPLLLLLLQLAPLVLGDDVIPISHIHLLQLWSALFHAGEVGHLNR